MREPSSSVTEPFFGSRTIRLAGIGRPLSSLATRVVSIRSLRSPEPTYFSMRNGTRRFVSIQERTLAYSDSPLLGFDSRMVQFTPLTASVPAMLWFCHENGSSITSRYDRSLPKNGSLSCELLKVCSLSGGVKTD